MCNKSWKNTEFFIRRQRFRTTFWTVWPASGGEWSSNRTSHDVITRATLMDDNDITSLPCPAGAPGGFSQSCPFVLPRSKLHPARLWSKEPTDRLDLTHFLFSPHFPQYISRATNVAKVILMRTNSKIAPQILLALYTTKERRQSVRWSRKW